MSGERFEPVISRTVTRKNAERFEGDTGLEFLDFWVESHTEFSQRVLVSCLTWQLASFITQTVSRDDRQRSVRRYSSLPWAGVLAFYFDILHVILVVYLLLLKELEMFAFRSQTRVTSVKHVIYCTLKFLLGLVKRADGKWLATVVRKKNNIPIEYVSRNILSAGSDSKMFAGCIPSVCVGAEGSDTKCGWIVHPFDVTAVFTVTNKTATIYIFCCLLCEKSAVPNLPSENILETASRLSSKWQEGSWDEADGFRWKRDFSDFLLSSSSRAA